MEHNKRFKILLNSEFIKSGYETTLSYNQSKEYYYKSSIKRFILHIKNLTAWACEQNIDACPYYKNCLQSRLTNNCMDKCGLEYIQKNVDNLIICEYIPELVRTEKLNLNKREYKRTKVEEAIS